MRKQIAEKIRQRLQASSPKIAPAVQPSKKPSPPPPPKLDKIKLQFLESMSPTEVDSCVGDVMQGRLYSFQNLSQMLRCSKDTTRRLFSKEPGVLRFKHIYRVPETVVQRVLTRMMRGRI